jgi:hypothetical protein
VEIDAKLEENDIANIQDCMENDNAFLQDCMENSEKDVNIMLESKNQDSIPYKYPFVKPAFGDMSNTFKRLALASPNQDIEGNPGPSKPEFGIFANGQFVPGPGVSFFTNYGQGLTGKLSDEIFFTDQINSNEIFSGKDCKHPDPKLTQRDYLIFSGKGHKIPAPWPIKKLHKPDPTDPSSDQKLPASDQKLPPSEKWAEPTIDDNSLQFLIDITEFHPPTSEFVEFNHLLPSKDSPPPPSPLNLFHTNPLPSKQFRKIIKTRRSNPSPLDLTHRSPLDLPPYDPATPNPTQKYWRSFFEEGYYKNGKLNGPALCINRYANIHIGEFLKNKKQGYGLSINNMYWKREAEYAKDKISGKVIIWRKNYREKKIFGLNSEILQGKGAWGVVFEGNGRGRY